MCAQLVRLSFHSLSSIFNHQSLFTLAEAEVVASAIGGTDIVSPLCCYYGYKEPASVVLVRRLSGCWRGTDLPFGDTTASSRYFSCLYLPPVMIVRLQPWRDYVHRPYSFHYAFDVSVCYWEFRITNLPTPWRRVLPKKRTGPQLVKKFLAFYGTPPKVHHRTHKRPPPMPILSQSDPVHAFQSNFLKISFNIILSTPLYFKWSLSIRVFHIFC